MPGFFQNFERVAAQFNPVVLVSFGLTAVVLGLFAWLGGLSHRKFLAVTISAVSSGICGLLVKAWKQNR